jgi:hypothetical protein
MSQIMPELKNAIITIGTHRVLLRARGEERRRQELLCEGTIIENIGNQASASSRMAHPTPRYPDHHVGNRFAYDRDATTPTPVNVIAPDTTVEDDRERSDKTPNREDYELTPRAKFLQTFRQAVSGVVREGEVKQARRRARETSGGSLSPTTSSIIAIPEETPTEALLRKNLADSSEEETRTTYLQNMQTTMGRLQFNRSTQSIVDTDITNEFDIVDRHKAKRRRLND